MAGLDVGWGQQLDMAPDPRYQHRFLLQRELPPGCYTYKFVIVSRSPVTCLLLSQLLRSSLGRSRAGGFDVILSVCLLSAHPTPFPHAPPCQQSPLCRMAAGAMPPTAQLSWTGTTLTTGWRYRTATQTPQYRCG